LTRSEQFRKILKTKGRVLLAGAHDALSAKLIEEAGFDAVWASSFGISASSKCLPDANVLTMTEALEAVKGMNEAISIPLIADCDNGYGNAINVIRMTREYERAGVAGISIEDNPFPKKCSLYPGERQELVDIDEMAGRIHAAKSTQRTKDFFVIARTEALIAGLGLDEAFARARAYEEAGADAILIHSRQPVPDEIRAFAARWKARRDGRAVPLVAVPTKYPGISSKELAKIGIPIVIFANQALRASVVAMKETLSEMKRLDRIGPVDKKVAPLSEIFRLVGQPMMEENEKRFVKNFKKAPSAVIVAAGFEENLWPLNSERPKAMLEIRGKSILERQRDLLRRAGIERIAVVTGYKREKVSLPQVQIYPNANYRTTGSLHSLFCAEEEARGKFVFLYGDVLFEEHVLEKLLKSKADVTLAVKRPLGSDGSKPERDLVVLRGPAGQEEIAAIGHQLGHSEANGEFMGLALFSKRGAQSLREIYESLSRKNGHSRFHNAPNLRSAQFTDMIQEMLARKHKVHAVCLSGGWLDIETFEDYRKAWQEVKA
jgi:phosphoenolpyruvate phosphomutase